MILTILCTVAHNLGSETKKAAGIPMFMAIGQCGSILGSHIFPKTEGPKYVYVFSNFLGYWPNCPSPCSEKDLQVSPSCGMPAVYSPLRIVATSSFLRASISRCHLLPDPFSMPSFFNGLVAIWLSLKISYRTDNARRDRVHGKPGPGSRVDTRELADKVGFRAIEREQLIMFDCA
jgi:hypothetical protein